jgi:hypothetical protein
MKLFYASLAGLALGFATLWSVGMVERLAVSHEPAKYHHGQSNTGWQQLNTANAIACHTYMPPAGVVRCLIATGAAI